ncbi:hypothetical protein GDR29_20575 [Xanthomonas oryzae pv. oryzae]|nr:hypothetical protein GDR29_20575 [Xanthomonas oryzae pv. oryzae]
MICGSDSGQLGRGERFLALAQIQGGIADLHRIQLQRAPQQRAQVRLQIHTLGGEVDVLVVKIHIAQG